MSKLFLFSLVLLLGGCSSVERIGADAHGIRESATATLEHLDTIKDIGSAEVVVEASAAEAEQENIIELAEDIKQLRAQERSLIDEISELKRANAEQAAKITILEAENRTMCSRITELETKASDG